MKIIFKLILICLYVPSLAQPTGYQKIFLEITDGFDTLDFKSCFKKNELSRKTHLKYRNYQLFDIGKHQTGFNHNPNGEFIYKTLMTANHEILIVKNKKDTMRIQLLNAFKVYFLSIPFQKGKFKLIINDGNLHKWNYNTLPYKKVNSEQLVYDITPINWDVFNVDHQKQDVDYFISVQFAKQQLLATPIIPEDDPNFRNPRRMNNLELEVRDFNFDGKQDYRERKWNDNKKWNYFIYADSTIGFVLDTMLSRMNIVKIDFEKKTFDVQNSKSGIDTYQFINDKPSLVPQEKTNVFIDNEKQKTIEQTIHQSIKTYEVNPFRFELEFNLPDIEIPASKGYYANRISVYDTKVNQLIFTTVAVGNKLKETLGCADSLQIADYNFDGFPDFRICNNSVLGKHTYYIFHPKRNTFIIEKTLTELNSLSFDFEQKIAIGNTDRKEFTSYPWNSPFQYYMETLQFEGNALENLKVTTTTYGSGTSVTAIAKYINQKRIYDGDSLAIKMQKNNWLIKTVGPFKFEVEFNPEDYKPGAEKGSYVKVLNIYKKDRAVGHFEMHGNYLKEVPHWLDSLEIADYNFDGFPDIRIYKSSIANGSYSYLLFNPEKEIQQFYEDGLISASIETEFFPNQKIWKGKIVESNLTRYLFFINDTLTIKIQDNDISKPPFIEESIYKNGTRTIIRSAYNNLEPVLKKEYDDYNFDGYEDFRQQSKKNPNYWDVFIYNPKQESFVKDTLLSNFEFFNYNKLDKTLDGYIRIKSSETTKITKYYKWSFSEKKMLLYQEKVCSSKYPGEERNHCVVSKLVNGKWIEIIEFGVE